MRSHADDSRRGRMVPSRALSHGSACSVLTPRPEMQIWCPCEAVRFPCVYTPSLRSCRQMWMPRGV